MMAFGDPDMSRPVLSALILCAFAGTAAAQGLGDAARKEGERRSRGKGPAKTYTGDDLAGGTSTTGRAAQPVATAAAAGTAAPARPEREQPRPIPDDSAARAREEVRWRRNVQGLRQSVSTLERQAEEADRAATMSAYGGPMNCAGFVNTRHERNLAEVQEARQALADARKALDDFEEEARRAGVPPGWLR
jgi:hypothetical protein